MAAPLPGAARRHAILQRCSGTFRGGSVARHHRNRTGIPGTCSPRPVAGPGRLRRSNRCRGTRLAYGEHRGRVPRPGGLDGIPRRPIRSCFTISLELLRARPAEPAPLSTELAEELRQRDRATVEALRELAGAVARVRTGISEIQRGFQQRGPEQTGQSGSVALGDVADVVGELRTATSALTTAVTKLDDIAAGLAAISPIGLSAPARGNLPPGSRSQLSTELQELLRDMATGSTPRQDSSR